MRNLEPKLHQTQINGTTLPYKLASIVYETSQKLNGTMVEPKYFVEGERKLKRKKDVSIVFNSTTHTYTYMHAYIHTYIYIYIYNLYLKRVF